MLTARTFAKEKGISYTTVMAWLRDGLIPGAEQQETPMGMVWQIPQSSLDLVTRQKPGPKPQSTDGEAATATDAADERSSAATGKKAAKVGKSAAKKMSDIQIIRALRKMRPEIYGMTDEEFQEIKKLAKAEDRKSVKKAGAKKGRKKEQS